ncbi:MAG: GNAT family N-acetyltransferase [Caldimonas sp.]
MPSSALHIRPMMPAELDVAVEWAAAEGWNPGWHDADTFHAADPGGFLLGQIDDTLVAAISAVRYGGHFGFIGFYIVRPEFRGQGHGIAIWRAAMQQLAGRTIGLDGVVAQQGSYRKSGFVLAWNNVRHEVIAGSSAYRDSSIAPLFQATADLLAYDASFFPDDRRVFVRHWIAQPGSTTLTLRQDGRLAGYGTIRPCRIGFKVGPLFADDAHLADRLLRALITYAKPGEPVQLDTPAANPAAIALAQALGMRPVFETARMYAGQAPALPLGKIFGITTYELG